MLGVTCILESQSFFKHWKSRTKLELMICNVYLARHQQVLRLVRKANMTNNRPISLRSYSRSDLVIILQKLVYSLYFIPNFYFFTSKVSIIFSQSLSNYFTKVALFYRWSLILVPILINKLINTLYTNGSELFKLFIPSQHNNIQRVYSINLMSKAATKNPPKGP